MILYPGSCSFCCRKDPYRALCVWGLHSAYVTTSPGSCIPLVFYDLLRRQSQCLSFDLLETNRDTKLFGFYSNHISRLVSKDGKPHYGHTMPDGLHYAIHPSMGDEKTDARVSCCKWKREHSASEWNVSEHKGKQLGQHIHQGISRWAGYTVKMIWLGTQPRCMFQDSFASV